MRRTIRTGPGSSPCSGRCCACSPVRARSVPPPTSKRCRSRRGDTLPIARLRHSRVDGKLDEPAWTAAPWTELFVDIEGDSRPQPRFRTRVKMLWDDESFYVAAEMEEPDLWGTLTAARLRHLSRQRFRGLHRSRRRHARLLRARGQRARHAVGPDADQALSRRRPGDRRVGHRRPAGRHRPARHAQPAGRSRRRLDASRSRCRGGSCARPRRTASRRSRATAGASTSRASSGRLDRQDGRYAKRLKPGTKDPLPESNWVWSPQGAINMHMPERWGYVQFSGVDGWVAAASRSSTTRTKRVKWALRRLYYRQRTFRQKTGSYASALSAART